MTSMDRALYHLGMSKWIVEADSGSVLCHKTRDSVLVARITANQHFLRHRSRLEYAVKAGNVYRTRLLLDRGLDNWALYDAPPSAARDLLDPSRAYSKKPTQPLLSGFGPRIEGSLAEWRAANPTALEANVAGRHDLTDTDFAHLAGIKALNMAHTRGLTDAAFVHLRGIHTLSMYDCPWVSDMAFWWLRGIHTLYMWDCHQITGYGFQWLCGIHSLYINNCSGVQDAAFVHLRGINMLAMIGCQQITDAGLAHLKGISTLAMNECTQKGITVAGLRHLRGILTLRLFDCSQEIIDAVNSLGLLRKR